MITSDIARTRRTSHNQGQGRNTYPRRRPSLAFALALLALVVSLSSGAYAATTAQRNSVLSKSIKNGQVKTQDLAADAISSDKIADGTVLGADLAEGSVGAGSLGTIETFAAVSPPASDADGIMNGGDHGVTQVKAYCPAGSTPISGGATWVVPSNINMDAENFYLQGSRRTVDGWLAEGIVDMGAQGTIHLRAYVDCLMPNGYVPN